MSIFKREKPGNDAPAANPTVQEEPQHHNPFLDWLPPPAQPHAPSLAPYVDDDLHKPAAAPTPQSIQGGVYAAMLSGMGDTTNSHQQHYQIINMLESVTDPAVRHEMMKQYKEKTGKSLDDFIKSSKWDGDRDKNEALALISPERDKADAELASMPPEKRAQTQKLAMAVAKTIDSTAGKDGADDKENAHKMADALYGKSPAEIEAIRAAIQTTTHGHQGTYELLDRSLSHGNEDEAVAALSGDPVHTAIAGMFNAEGDPKRAREILDRLDANQMKEFKQSMFWSDAIVASMPETERKELELRIHGNRPAADAARVASLLADPKDMFIKDTNEKPADSYDMKKGLELRQHAQDMAELRQPENIARELEKMSADELKAARAAYDPKEHGGKTLDQLVAERFDPDDVNGQRVAALLRGDKVGDKAIELREGMRTHNQEEIEHALANDDLGSTNKERHERGLAEQQELAARVQEMDAPKRPSWMPALPNAPKGRTLDKQLEDSYGNYITGKTSDDDPFQAQSQMNAMLERDKREKRVVDDRIANKELLETGKLSHATEMYRARDSKEKQAELLDETESNKELHETAHEYKEKYGKDMIATPDSVEKWAYLAQQRHMAEMMRGKDRPLEEIEREIAQEDRDVNEQRIEQTRTEGVRAERTDDQLRHDQHEIYDKQYSDRLEKVEQQREFWGGGIGSQHMWREGIEAMDGTKDTQVVHQLDKVAGAEQQTAREEKVELAERSAKIFTTVAKLGSFLAGGPLGTAVFNGIVGLAGAQMKKSIGGEAIDMTKEYKEVGIDFGGELLTMGLNGEYSEAREAWEAEEALKAGKTLKAVAIEEGRREAKEKAAQKLVGTAAGKILTTEAQDKLVKGKSDDDTAVDIAGATIGQILPGFFGGKIEHGLGKNGTDEIVAKGIGVGTEKVTDKVIDGATENYNADEKAKEVAKKRAEEAELEKQKAETEPEREHESG